MNQTKDTDEHEIIKKRYETAINYYTNSSKKNKRWYKSTRSLIVVVGSIVTLTSSLSSSEVFADSQTFKILFSIGTPCLAAILTIVSGFSQSFQWGSTWQNMVLTSQVLEKEYNSYLVTPVDQRDYKRESEKINSLIITETQGFFGRMLGTKVTLNKIQE